MIRFKNRNFGDALHKYYFSIISSSSNNEKAFYKWLKGNWEELKKECENADILAVEEYLKERRDRT